MSDPTVQSLAAEIRALTERLEELKSGLNRLALEDRRLGEISDGFRPRIASLEAGRFAGNVDVSGDLQIGGRAQSTDEDSHLHLDASALFIHGSDIILDGRSRPLNPKLYRALVDLGNQLVINFRGDYGNGVACQSSLTVDGDLSVGGDLEVKGLVVTNSTLRVDQLESSTGRLGIIDVDAAQVRIHGGDLILDGRSVQLDSTRPYRALVDMGHQLVINFNGDYQNGVLVSSDLIVAGSVGLGLGDSPGHMAFQNTVGQETIKIFGDSGQVEFKNSAGQNRIIIFGESGQMQIHNGAGQSTVKMFGDSGNIRANTVFAVLRPPGGDCAEQLDVAGAGPAEPGTVMVIGADGALEPCTTAHDARVAGVISGAGDLEPGIVLNERDGGNRAPIALIGTVYCKCNAAHGAIAAGDLLTTSPTKGHAMRVDATHAMIGSIIGKALKGLPEGSGLVPILVAPR